MNTYTETPWILDYADDAGRLVVRNNETSHPQGPFVIADINQSRGLESHANARLIAAAPELLEAVADLLGTAELNQDDLEPETCLVLDAVLDLLDRLAQAPPARCLTFEETQP